MAGKQKEEGKEYSANWGGYRGGGRPKGSKNPNAGRKKMDESEKRSRNIGIRVTEEELQFLKGKASEFNLSLTDLFIEAVKKM